MNRVSPHELTRALPDELKSSLPTIEELEAELSSGPLAADDLVRLNTTENWRF